MMRCSALTKSLSSYTSKEPQLSSAYSVDRFQPTNKAKPGMCLRASGWTPSAWLKEIRN